MSFPIETARLEIRPLTLADVEAMHVLYTDPEVMRFIPAPLSADLDVSRQRVQRKIDWQAEFGCSLWAVVEKESGLVIGDCGVFPFEGKGPEFEIGYHIRRDRWGMGYATEAAAACLKYGFDEMELPRIVAVTFPDNFASRRVLTKIGMREEGLARAYEYDVVFFSKDNPARSA
jgi:[ribosomal protein S5]-alanine N-acetyltransferase